MATKDMVLVKWIGNDSIDYDGKEHYVERVKLLEKDAKPGDNVTIKWVRKLWNGVFVSSAKFKKGKKIEETSEDIRKKTNVPTKPCKVIMEKLDVSTKLGKEYIENKLNVSTKLGKEAIKKKMNENKEKKTTVEMKKKIKEKNSGEVSELNYFYKL